VTEDKSTRYHRLRRRAELAGMTAAGACLLTLVSSGGAIRLREAADAAAVRVAPGPLQDVTTVALVATVVLLLLHLAEAPFAYFHGFVLERRYGLTAQPRQQWVRDQLAGATLSTAIGVMALSVVYGSLRQWPAGWWLVSAVTLAGGLVLVVQLAPILLLPRFYTVRPLDRQDLAGRLSALSARAGAEVVGVFEWVVSGHTRKANAALAGLGRTRRILLSDTLLADFSDDEIEVVLAHELAHHVHHDLWRSMAAQVGLLLTGLLVAHVTLGSLAGRLGYRSLADPASVPLLLLFGGAWSLLALPGGTALSRSRERAADRYALEVTGRPDAFMSAMRRLAQQNMAEERPGPLARLFLSHPPIRERLDAARAFTRT
jgi:STE24 endopeptidase